MCRRCLLLIFFALFLSSGCSLNNLVASKLGDALAAGGDTFSADEDPELIGEAAPFSLKLMESLLAETPRHRGLLLAAAKGFTQYSVGWIHLKADEIEESDLDEATAMRARARRMYLRARGYALRGLELRDPRFGEEIRRNPKEAVATARAEDVPFLYWGAASWVLAISLSKDDPELVADLPAVEAMIDRALELDEDYEQGAIHSFLISYDQSRPGIANGEERARAHFARAIELSAGQLAAPYVTLAESVSVAKQNRAEFDSLLEQALAIDPDRRPASRLENILAQRRARWLLDHADDLILSSEGESDE